MRACKRQLDRRARACSGACRGRARTSDEDEAGAVGAEIRARVQAAAGQTHECGQWDKQGHANAPKGGTSKVLTVLWVIMQGHNQTPASPGRRIFAKACRLGGPMGGMLIRKTEEWSFIAVADPTAHQKNQRHNSWLPTNTCASL